MDDGPTVARGSSSTRRGVLRGVVTGGLVLPVLAACGSTGGGDEPSGGAGGGTTPETGDGSSGAGGPEGVTLPTSDVPVGGGTIIPEDMVVVTQPTEGEFKAFSARCTHQGCPVQTVADGEIGCNCHQSAFSIEDGSVITGPAPRALDPLQVSVEGDQVVVG